MSDSGVSLTLPPGSIDMNELHNALTKKNVKQEDVDAAVAAQAPADQPAPKPAPEPIAEPEPASAAPEIKE